MNMKKKSTEKNQEFPSKPLNMLESASTSSFDIALFKALGLKTFSEIPISTEYFVGKIKFKNNSVVKIWVHPMPAMFWKFEVFISDRNCTAIVSTGSGVLSNYWHTIKLFADGMIDVVIKN